MRTRSRHLVLFLLATMTLLSTAKIHAAQNAMITVEKAEIRESRSLDAPTIETKSAGAKIRISSRSKDGWYKIRATNGQFGWIWQADLAVLGDAADTRNLGLDSRGARSERQPYSQPRFYLMGGAAEFTIFPADLNDRMNQKTGNYYMGLDYFGQISLRMDERLRFAFRVMNYDFSSAVVANNKNYTVEFSSTPLLIGFENSLFQGDHFEVMAGLFGGIGYNNKLVIVSTDDAVPNSVTFESSDLALLFTVDLKYWLSRHIGIVLEGGVYFSQMTSVSVSTPFNGSTTFVDPQSGGYASFNVNHFGPVVGAALELGF